MIEIRLGFSFGNSCSIYWQVVTRIMWIPKSGNYWNYFFILIVNFIISFFLLVLNISKISSRKILDFTTLMKFVCFAHDLLLIDGTSQIRLCLREFWSASTLKLDKSAIKKGSWLYVLMVALRCQEERAVIMTNDYDNVCRNQPITISNFLH